MLQYLFVLATPDLANLYIVSLSHLPTPTLNARLKVKVGYCRQLLLLLLLLLLLGYSAIEMSQQCFSPVRSPVESYSSRVSEEACYFAASV